MRGSGSPRRRRTRLRASWTGTVPNCFCGSFLCPGPLVHRQPSLPTCARRFLGAPTQDGLRPHQHAHQAKKKKTKSKRILAREAARNAGQQRAADLARQARVPQPKAPLL